MKRKRLFILICAMLICLASVGCQNISETETKPETEVSKAETESESEVQEMEFFSFPSLFLYYYSLVYIINICISHVF